MVEMLVERKVFWLVEQMAQRKVSVTAVNLDDTLVEMMVVWRVAVMVYEKVATRG